MTIRPEAIFVHWSESPAFKSNTLYPFHEFELKARTAASKVKVGYDKTKITAHLSDGSSVQVRCDLAEDDDHGFASVVRSYQDYYAEETPADDTFAKLMMSITIQ